MNISDLFNSLMEWRREVADLEQNVNDMNETLISNINCVASDLRMLHRSSNVGYLFRKP